MKQPFLSKRNNIYYLYYWQNGKRKKRSTGCSRKTNAQVKMGKLLLEIERKNDSKEIMLFNYSYEFQRNIEAVGASKSYLAQINRAFNKLYLDLGDVQLKAVSTFDVDRFLLSIRSVHTRLNYYKALYAGFKKAVTWKFISANPLEEAIKPKPPFNHPRYITLDELTLLVKCEPNIFFADIYNLAFYTGMRRGELTSLRWNQVNIEGRVIRLNNSEAFKTKSRKERIIPLCKKAIEIMIRRNNNKRPNDIYVFGKYYDVPIEGRYVSDMFKIALRKAKLDDRIHFLSLRHGFGSYLIQQGVNVTSVQALMGHADISTTMGYVTLHDNACRDAVKVFD